MGSVVCRREVVGEGVGLKSQARGLCFVDLGTFGGSWRLAEVELRLEWDP